MSGTCSNERKTTWKSDWDVKSASSKDFDNTSDTASQFSDPLTDEQSCSDASGVKERMRRLFEKQLYTDVTFYPKNDGATSISAHRAFLAVGSPLFADMLFGKDAEGTSRMQLEIKISNMSFNAFSNIVKYLYTDEVFFENDDLVTEILQGAEQFEIQSLVDRCKSYFENVELTEENVCTHLQNSISKKIHTLEDRCVKYIQKNTFKVLNSDAFLRSSFSTINEVFKLQSFNLRSEMALLKAAMNWNNFHSPAGNYLQIKPLLKYIRFLTLTATELSDIITKHPDLLTSEEALQIMLYLHNPSSSPNFGSLPSWCNKNTTSRCFVENPRNSATENYKKTADNYSGISLSSSTSVLIDLGVTEDKIDELPCVGEFMNILYRKQLFTDVTFFSSNGQESVSAHRAVLAAKSPFFAEFLFMKQIYVVSSMEMKVKISSFSFDAFCNIIKYLYTDEIDFTDDSTVMDIFIAAKQFQIHPLIERCESYIECIDLTMDNVCSILQISDTKDIKALKERCIKYIEGNTDQVIISADFKKCTYNTIYAICNLQSFNFSNEVQLLDAIVRWVNIRPSHTQLILRTHLLSCVRFLTLTAGDLSRVAKKYPGILKDEDLLKIIMFITGSADIESLPSWCNKSIKGRCPIKIKKARKRPNRRQARNRIGNVLIPLKPSLEGEELAKVKVKSYIHMKCIQGYHKISAIRFSFQDTPLSENSQESILFKLHLEPRLVFQKKVNVCSNEEEITLFRKILVSEGDNLKIQAETNGMKSCRFFQIDEDISPLNEHFQCTVTSHPKHKKFFFIREIEYW